MNFFGRKHESTNDAFKSLESYSYLTQEQMLDWSGGYGRGSGGRSHSTAGHSAGSKAKSQGKSGAYCAGAASAAARNQRAKNNAQGYNANGTKRGSGRKGGGKTIGDYGRDVVNFVKDAHDAANDAGFTFADNGVTFTKDYPNGVSVSFYGKDVTVSKDGISIGRWGGGVEFSR